MTTERGRTFEPLLPHAGAVLGAARAVEAARPVLVLAPLVLAHLAVVTAIALAASHNGWLYGSPGPSMNDWTAAWALGHLWVPAAAGAYGAPVLLWPLALAFGGSLAAALHLLVVLQTALGAAGVVAIYAIGARTAGRVFGYVAALAWVLAPLLSLGFFYAGRREFLGVPYDDYRGLVLDTVVPNALGLAFFPGFLSLLALVVSAWLLVRCLDTGAWDDLLLSALAAGLAIGIEPTNAVFLPAPLVALSIARRRRHAGAFVLALLPALVTLVLWRWTGRGDAFGFDGLPFAWEDFRINRIHLRGAGWSLLLVAWIAVSGSYALVRKAPAKGALVVLWFAGFFVVNSGSLVRGRALDASLFRLLEPGYPAFVLLAAAVLLLVPPWGRPRAEPPSAERPLRPTRGLVVAAVGLALYPLALVALAGPAPRDRVVVQQARDRSAPVSDELALRIARREGRVTLEWTRPRAGDVSLSYRVYRSSGAGCAYRDTSAQDCLLRMAGAATVSATEWTDPERGRFRYRVAALADHRRGRIGGDLLLIGPASD